MKKSIRIVPALLLAGILPAAVATAADDPFVRAPAEVGEQEDDNPKFLSICFESFSVSLGEAVALYQGQPNDIALYKEITSRVAKGKAKQEIFTVVRARSGERATLKNTSEFSYPASYLPAASSGGKQSAPSAPKPNTPAASPTPAPVAPTAPPTSALPFPTEFKTRDIGLNLVIEPTLGANNRIIDLRIEPVLVTLADRAKWGQGDSATETPVFEVQSITTANTMLDGQTQLLGTMSRPASSKADAESADRIWFAFVTPKVVTVPRDKK
ncbi:MAG: hypothetical protein EOP83_05505 [Verrucomicrobiaceae bacterium]|nr:MAG: hypothetical protein EOP83_05505 [Verrucomicrobiaceae bacterium]